MSTTKSTPAMADAPKPEAKSVPAPFDGMSLKRTVTCSAASFHAVNFTDVDDSLPIYKQKYSGRSVKASISDKETARNIFSSEYAELPMAKDTLEIKCTLKVVPHLLKLHSGTLEQRLKYKALLADMLNDAEVRDIVLRAMVRRLVEGYWAWRNQEECDKRSIVVSFETENGLVSYEFTEAPNEAGEQALCAALWRGATEKTVIFHITGRFRMGEGQEVYPSQLMVLDGKADGRQFYTVPGSSEEVGMRGAKLANALRTIDTWFPDYEAVGEAIAVEVLGGSHSYGVLFREFDVSRPGKNKSAYDFVYNVFTGATTFPQMDRNDRCYLLSAFIRGALFTVETDDSKKKKAAKKDKGTTKDGAAAAAEEPTT